MAAPSVTAEPAVRDALTVSTDTYATTPEGSQP